MRKNLEHPIAYGRTAEIYEWQSGQVLKLFHDWFSLESIQYEQRIAQAVHASGLPVPSVGELIRVNDRNGLVYQRVESTSMWEMNKRRPWNLFRHARRMAELHVEMHTHKVQVNLPNQRQRLIEKISTAEALPANLRDKALAALESMPDGHRLCHGDFHPGNIIGTEGNVVIVDWIDAVLGNPIADLARTTILLRGAVEAGQIGNVLQKAIVGVFHSTYVRHYFSLAPGGEDEYHRWLPVVAAARLSENITELEPWLIAQAEVGL